jgi:hypothetical protein
MVAKGGGFVFDTTERASFRGGVDDREGACVRACECASVHKYLPTPHPILRPKPPSIK